MNEFLSIGRNKVHYQVEGSGQPIVWIHGGGVDHRMWEPQVQYFRGHYQVITYDIRGHGKSEYKTNDRPDISDLEALLDHLDISNITLAGLSLGGILAIDFVLAHPEKVDRLILMSPGLVGVQEKEPSYLQSIQKLMAAVQTEDMEAVAAVIMEMTFSKNDKKPSPELEAMKAYVQKTTTGYFESGNYTRIPQLKEPEPVQRLAEIGCPALIIYGSEDSAYMAKNVEVLGREITQSQILLLEGAGHLVNVERKYRVNEAIGAFLNS